MRPLLQAVLCIALCPVLVAQQASQAASPLAAATPASTPTRRYLTLPTGTDVELLAPGPTRFARQKPGAAVQFVVDRELMLDGVPLFYAGVPVAGVVEAVKRGSRFKHRAAEMVIRVTEMVGGQPIELHLRCLDPAALQTSDDEPHQGFNPLKVSLWIVAGLLVIALVAGDR